MQNQDIREEISKARIKLYEIAEGFNVTDSTFSRWLRKELSTEKKAEVRRIISKLKDGEN